MARQCFENSKARALYNRGIWGSKTWPLKFLTRSALHDGKLGENDQGKTILIFISVSLIIQFCYFEIYLFCFLSFVGDFTFRWSSGIVWSSSTSLLSMLTTDCERVQRTTMKKAHSKRVWCWAEFPFCIVTGCTKRQENVKYSLSLGGKFH